MRPVMLLVAAGLLFACGVERWDEDLGDEPTALLPSAPTTADPPSAPTTASASETAAAATSAAPSSTAPTTAPAPEETVAPERGGGERSFPPEVCPESDEAEMWNLFIRDLGSRETAEAQRVVGAAADGEWGPKSAAALERWIAAGCQVEEAGERPVTAQSLNETPCPAWPEEGDQQFLRRMTAEAGPDFDWRVSRDPDRDGYPCEDQIGEGYLTAESTARLGAAEARLLADLIRGAETISPAYDRGEWKVSWPAAVDRYLSWREPDCRWAYYDPGPPICDVNRNDPHREHLVAVAEAHRSGGYAWSDAEKRRFYTYLPNLYVMSADANGKKSDEDAASWRPRDPGAWCRFATEIIEVKTEFGLSADPPEAEALEEMLAAC